MRLSSSVSVVATVLLLSAATVCAEHQVLTYKQWRSRTGSNNRELYSSYKTKAELRSQPAVARPPPENIGDVARVTWNSFCTTGIVGFGWTAASQCRSGSPMKEIMQAGMLTGQRWGRISAGFAGGAAAASLALGRREDSTEVQLIASAIGGIAAASSVEQIPASVATFVAFSLVMSRLAQSQANAQNEPPTQHGRGRVKSK